MTVSLWDIARGNGWLTKLMRSCDHCLMLQFRSIDHEVQSLCLP
jgi:hypothetical protein